MNRVDIDIPAHCQAVRAHLIARGVPTGYGERPEGAGWQGAPGQSEFVGYAVIWRIGSVETRNMLLDIAYTEARPTVQVTTVGATADQADDVHGLVQDAMLDNSLQIPGRDLEQVQVEVSITTTKDTDEKPPVFYGGARYRIVTEHEE